MGEEKSKKNILLITSEKNAYLLREYYELAFPPDKFKVYTNSTILNYTLKNTDKLLPDDNLEVYDDNSIERIVNDSNLFFDLILVHHKYRSLIPKLILNDFNTLAMIAKKQYVRTIKKTQKKEFPSVDFYTDNFMDTINAIIDVPTH